MAKKRTGTTSGANVRKADLKRLDRITGEYGMTKVRAITALLSLWESASDHERLAAIRANRANPDAAA